MGVIDAALGKLERQFDDAIDPEVMTVEEALVVCEEVLDGEFSSYVRTVADGLRDDLDGTF